MDPVQVLAALGGAATWSQLMSHGVTDGRLRAAVRRGRVSRVAEGAYALTEADVDVVTAVRLRGRLTCCTAARRHGLQLLRDPGVPHVAVPRNRSGRSTEAVLHRGDVPGSDVVVPVIFALLTLLRCLPLVEAVVAVDSALRAGLVSAGQLARQLRGPGSVKARLALMATDARSGSVIERVVRLALAAAGLPVSPQVWIDGVGRVDFVVDGWLVVEIDGFAYHSERRQFREDRRRANALVARGYVLLRFSYEDVVGRLDELVAVVVAAYAAGR